MVSQGVMKKVVTATGTVERYIIPRDSFLGYWLALQGLIFEEHIHEEGGHKDEDKKVY